MHLVMRLYLMLKVLDVQVRRARSSDPLICHTNIPVRTARQVEAAMKRLKPMYKDFTLPLLGIHGDTDRCTSMRAHKEFMEKASSVDKTFDVIPGGYHEMLLGPQKDECFMKMSTWMLARLGSKPQIQTPL
jgi:acylglycerol lipase